MKYINETVRRRDRLMDEARARELLESSEYGVLSMVTPEGEPYGIPVNMIWDGRESLYIHCAPVGRKLDALAVNPKVSVCFVGHTKPLPAKFTTEYESVVVSGTAHFHLTDEEKMDALHRLVDKYSPDFKALGDKYAHKSFHRVEVIRIDIETFSGKCKHVPTADL